MLEELIKKMEDNIDSDEFEWIEEECREKIEESHLGLSAFEPLIQRMERHPLANFGVPGVTVNFVEKYYKEGYEDILYQSIKRSPAMHTV